MKSWEIGDYCTAMESALGALEYLIMKVDEAAGYEDQKEYNSLAFARDASMKRTKELLHEFASALENNSDEK